MEKLQNGLQFLLDKYSVDAKAVLKDRNTVVIDGVEAPILSYKNERRFIELKNIVQGGTLVGLSVMRVASTQNKGTNVFDQLARELGICQFVLGRKIKTITAMQNGEMLNVIAAAEGGVVCTLEIAATLPEGEAPKDKHEIISQRGIACDVVVDAQLQQQSVYFFGDKNQSFTDVDFELYGLSKDDVAVVRAAFVAAQNNNTAELIAEAAELEAFKKAAARSVELAERVVL